MNDTQILRSLMESMQKTSQPKTAPYDTTAEVRRIEDGVAWVHIAGGVDETPVRLTINAKEGDNVQVRVSGGTAFLVGNGTAPPTDDTTANVAVKQAKEVEKRTTILSKVVDAISVIANNTRQYFWHTEEGDDTGAHITEIPQEEFLSDPENGGGNLLARSNGIAIRDGLKELAIFAANILRIGQMTITGDSLIKYDRYGTESFSIKSSANTTGRIKIPVESNEHIIYDPSDGISSYTYVMPDDIAEAISGANFGVDVSGGYYKTSTGHWTDEELIGEVQVDPEPSRIVYPESIFSFTHGTAATKTYIVNAIYTLRAAYDGDHTIVFSATGVPSAYSKCRVAILRVVLRSNLKAPYLTIGSVPTSGGAYSAVIGEELAAHKYELVIGKYNVSYLSDLYAFQIGNGTNAANRSDCFGVRRDGDVEMAVSTSSSVAADYALYSALLNLGWWSDVQHP